MCCESKEFAVVALRCGASSSGTTSRSKKTLHAAEQQRADVARARRRWMRAQGMFDPAHLVFLDETAANTKMMRVGGRCLRGERLIGQVPHGHWKTITFVGALRCEGMTAPYVIDGAMKGKTFLDYVEHHLAPTLRRNDTVVMDNLPAHKAAARSTLGGDATGFLHVSANWPPPVAPAPPRSTRRPAPDRSCRGRMKQALFISSMVHGGGKRRAEGMACDDKHGLGQ